MEKTMCNELAELRSKMQTCRLCSDLELGPKPIFQLGSQAKILIVGQAPGRQAHVKNRPFDDPSGVRLRTWLGVRPQQFYDPTLIGIFPMGLCFPGAARSGDLPPAPLCASTWRAPVMQALKNVKITLVLGRYAVDWHVPEAKGMSITRAVEQFSSGEDGMFILPHPSPRNNRWLKRNEWFEAQVVPRIQARIADLLGDSDVR